jgi:hypothetical protein
MIFLLSSERKTNTKSNLNVIVGTTKKFREMISAEWFFKNLCQRCRVVL